MLRLFILGLIALGVFGSPAYAGEVDFTPIITPVFAILGGLIMILVSFVLTWAFKLLKAKTGLELAALEDQIRETVSAFAYRGIDAALLAAKKRVGENGRVTIDNEFIAMAARYLVAAAPGYLVTLGVTKSDGSIDMERVRSFIEARIPTSNAAPVLAPTA
jgi:hypothetical protein